MFVGLWHIVKDIGQPIHSSLINIGVVDYPYTISATIRRRQLIDSFLSLPKDKRPPRSIWSKPSELEEWFDRVYSHGEKETEFEFNVDDVE